MVMWIIMVILYHIVIFNTLPVHVLVELLLWIMMHGDVMEDRDFASSCTEPPV